MKKIKFVVPTLFVRPDVETNCVEELSTHAFNHNPENRVYFVSNINSPEFMLASFSNNNIIKNVSNDLHNISKAVNIVAKEPDTQLFDYFCFVHSDLFFKDNTWINKLIETCEFLDSGIIGTRGHSTFKDYNKKIDNVFNINEIHEVLWSDGIMFFKTSLFNEVGYFDERFYGDCESNDFCYKALKAGYKNYFISMKELGISHRGVSFTEKSKQTDLLLKQVESSRKLFHSIWDDFIKDYKFNNLNKV